MPASSRPKDGALPPLPKLSPKAPRRLELDDPLDLLSQQMRLLIKGRGLKLSTVEKLAGVRINRWYRGVASMSAANLIRVAQALDLVLVGVDKHAVSDVLPLGAERAFPEA